MFRDLKVAFHLSTSCMNLVKVRAAELGREDAASPRYPDVLNKKGADASSNDSNLGAIPRKAHNVASDSCFNEDKSMCLRFCSFMFCSLLTSPPDQI